ncbi:hypothetical protein DUNSADRAFT_10644 [Dunaliella salina]|uniref:Guanylate cyclase domain-containing protein n=1 Tax=Dunaliella salina TaxID=3046 RepID=A0ABQ7GEY5_DUNSA|nr:hypothetical protein DUNSADRAFT_10644 [Dunaliella salina]|eukprot:KAF5833157.1 hypothetical protein DUNSADRAFT_10644 [Dunaliella salina]
MVCRLREVAAPAEGDKKYNDGIAKLEAMRRRQGSGRRLDMLGHAASFAKPAHTLTLSYANPALIEAFGGAEKARRWVDAHVSQNPLLLWQLSRSGEGEVYRHCLPGQSAQGGVLPLSVMSCRTQDVGPVLIIGVHCQENHGLMMGLEAPEGLRQPQQQKQRQKQPELGVGAHARKSKSSDGSSLQRKVSAAPAGLESQHHCQEFLHLAMAHLPFAVTLIDSSGRVFWQNGRSALLLGLLIGNNKTRDLRQSLQRMFILDPQALESLISALEEGQAWSGLVQVPSEEYIGQSRVDNAVGASMEGIQTLAFSASAEDLQHKNSKPAADAAKYHGSFGPETSTLDVSLHEKENEGHAPRQEAGLTLDGQKHWSQRPYPPLGPQAGSPAGSSSTQAASAAAAAAAGQAGDERASAADSMTCSMTRASTAGFSFPENLAGPGDAVPAVLPVPEIPRGSEADTPMPKANAINNGGQSAAASTVRLELSPASPASDPPSGQASPFARALQRRASCHAMPPWLKGERRPSEPLASDPLPKAPASCSVSPAPPPWLQEGQRPPQQRSDPIQRLPIRSSAESPVGGGSLRDDLPGPSSITGSSRVDFRRYSSRSAQRSVHTSGVLLEQDMVLSGASRALRMSSSQYAVGSLNYLAQSQEHAFSGATFSAAQTPAHYFDSIPEGRQEKEAQNSLPNGVEKAGEVETCAPSSEPLQTGLDTRHTCNVASRGARTAWFSNDGGGSKVVRHGQSSSATQLPFQWGASQRHSVPSQGTHHADGLHSSPLQKQHSKRIPTKKSWSGVVEAQSFEGRQSTRFDAQTSSASAPLLPKVNTGCTSAPLLPPQISVPSNEEGQNDAHSTSWNYLDAFTIKRPDGGKVTVLTNQDVTSWVDSQMSLKQILDVEHKILEDIFPKHVLESQVAAGAEVRLGKSTESGFNSSPSPMLSKRGSNQSQAWSADKDCRSHRSSRLGCMTSDTSRTSRSELLFIDPVYKLGSQKGSPFDSGASSPLPQAQSQRSMTMQRGMVSDRIRSMNSSMKLNHRVESQQRLSTATTGSTDEASGLLYFLGKIPSAEHGQHDDLIAQGAVQGTLILNAPAVWDPAHPGNQEQSRGQQVTPLSEQVKRPRSGSSNVQFPTRPSSPSMGQPRNVQGSKQAVSCSTAHVANNTLGRIQAAPTLDSGSGLRGSQGLGAAPRDPGLSVIQGGMGRHHENVTVMFADIKNFTAMSRAVSSVEVMHFLHTLFSQFDALVDSMEELGLYKIETIGDCYMCAAGLLTRGEDGAMVLWDGDGSPVHHLFTLAKQMLEVASRTEMPASGGQPVVLRIGMHTGPVTSGIAGRKCPRFCLFGDTVNFAARMESTCLPGMIHVSQATWEALGSPDQAADPRWTQTSGVMAKGIGFVQTYLWNGRQ